ncbi:MAG: acyltransferase family protein [Janthinobacterium lividum]
MTDTCADAPPLNARATGRVGRLASLDHMRGFVIGLVVFHHAILAYCTFDRIDRAHYPLSTAPIVDSQHWIVFDLLVRLNDAFFIPLLFLLSGLFVWDGLARRGAGAFLCARIRRLGLPFVVAVLTLIPLAYYPSFVQAGGEPGFGAFWIRTVTVGPWPSGPPWFIGVLLLFDAGAALLFVLAARGGASPYRPPRSASGFAVLLSGSWLLYMPLLIAIGPARWFAIGPLAVQGSRIGLYAIYFSAGVVLGRHGKPAVALFGQALSSRWRSWASLAALTGAGFISVGSWTAREVPHLPALVLVGTAQAAFCTAASYALPALFLRFGGGRSPAWDSLAANSFAIYLLHYPVVTWTQYALLAAPASAPAKGAITFAVALLGSWTTAALLRRLPTLSRIL